MAGYNKYSMSNNAILAYKNGEKPLSKWTKTTIVEAIEQLINNNELDLQCDIKKLRKLPIQILKAECLYYSSWHHTSNHYNKTNFYSIDVDNISLLTDEKIEQLINDYKTDTNPEPFEEKWKCSFLEWSGTRKHPKSTVVIEEGVVKGDWFIRSDGSKKKTTANGFCFLEKLN